MDTGCPGPILPSMPAARFIPMTLRRPTVLAAPVILVAAVAWLAPRTPETPIEAARRICDSCGLFEAEVDKMIDDMRQSTLNRDQLLDACRATYADSGDGEACIGCSEAILDAAGK